MKTFFKKGSFNNFQILTAFLVPTVVYLIFSVDWNDGYLGNNKQVINCKRKANQAVKNEVKAGRIFTREGQKKQYEIEMNVCLITLPKILEKQDTSCFPHYPVQQFFYKKLF